MGLDIKSGIATDSSSIFSLIGDAFCATEHLSLDVMNNDWFYAFCNIETRDFMFQRIITNSERGEIIDNFLATQGMGVSRRSNKPKV